MKITMPRSNNDPNDSDKPSLPRPLTSLHFKLSILHFIGIIAGIITGDKITLLLYFTVCLFCLSMVHYMNGDFTCLLPSGSGQVTYPKEWAGITTVVLTYARGTCGGYRGFWHTQDDLRMFLPGAQAANFALGVAPSAKTPLRWFIPGGMISD